MLGQTAEVVRLDDRLGSWVRGFQGLERVVEIYEHFELPGREQRRIPGASDRRSGNALLRTSPARIVDEHASHDSRSHGKEMVAVLPLDTRHVHEAEVRLVHQAGRVQRVVRSLPGEPRAGESLQLVVDDGDEPIERRSLSVAPATEKTGHIRRYGCPDSCLRARLEIPTWRSATP